MGESVFATAAPLLIAGGYSPLPIGPGVKYPAVRAGLNADGDSLWLPMRGWNQYCDEQPSAALIGAWGRMTAAHGGGLGVACGFGGLVAVDIDDEGLVTPLRAVLPTVVVAKRGRKGLTVFYRCEDAELKKKNYRTADKRGLADLLARGSQTVLPPTMHPDSGRPYEWTTPATLLNTPLAALPLLTREHIAAMEAVFAQHGWNDPEPRQRQGEAIARPARSTTSAVFADDDLSAAALENLSAWVPALGLPKTRRKRDGSYRAVAVWRSSGSGRDTGKRAPNLGFHPTGIRDFGGDGYSPVGVVMKALSLDFANAAAWLRDKLGIPDAPLIILHNGAGAPVAEPSYPDNRVPLSAAESAVAALVGGTFESAILDWRKTRNQQFVKPSIFVPSPPVIVGRIETGVGKSRAAIAAVARLAHRRQRIVYVVPRHNLADAVAAQFAAHGVRAEVYRGYKRDDPRDPEYKMCRNPTAYKAARDLGVNIRAAVCERRDDDKMVRCPLANACGMERQREARPQVWIVTAASLFLARPDFVFGGRESPIDALVIDERFHDHAFGELATIGVPALVRAKIEGCDHGETAFLADLRQRLIAAVETNGDGPLKRTALDAQGMSPNLALRASYLEQRVCTPKLLRPDMGEAELKTATYRSKDRTQLARTAGTVWEEIALFLAFHKDLSGRLAVAGDKITAKPLRPVHPSWHAATLILDATAPSEAVLAAALFGDDVPGWPVPKITTTEITAHWSVHVHARQIVGAPVTMSKLGLYDAPKPENERDVLRYINLRAAFAAPAKVGLITYKGLLDKNADKLPANVRPYTRHFGDLSGMNDMENVAGLIVIGRLSPRRAAVEADASVLAGRPVDGGGHHFDRVAGGIRMADGHAVHAEAVRHPDANVEALRWQVTEAELLQAVGRLRSHRRGEPCWLDIVCNVPLPITVHEVCDWVAPGAEADMAAVGLILANSRDAMPVFGLSKHEAEKVGNCPASLNESPYRKSGAVSPVRTVTYRKAGTRGPASTALYLPAVLPGGAVALRALLEPKLGPISMIEVERVRAKDSEAIKAMFARIGRETATRFDFRDVFSSALGTILNFFESMGERDTAAAGPTGPIDGVPR